MEDFPDESFCGLPDSDTPAPLAIWMETKNELFMRRPCPEVIWSALPGHLYNWKEDGNYFHVDLAIKLCESQQYEFTETLKKALCEAATARLEGKHKGTLTQIERDAINQLVFHWVACFVAAGISITQSTQKCAAFFAKICPDGKIKLASTIEKDYREQLKNSVVKGKNRVETMRDIYEKNPEEKSTLLALASTLHCPPELKGNVR